MQLAIANMLTHDELFTYNWFVLLSLSLTLLTDSILTMYCLKSVFVCFDWGLHKSVTCYKIFGRCLILLTHWSTIFAIYDWICFLTPLTDSALSKRVCLFATIILPLWIWTWFLTFSIWTWYLFCLKYL